MEKLREGRNNYGYVWAFFREGKKLLLQYRMKSRPVKRLLLEPPNPTDCMNSLDHILRRSRLKEISFALKYARSRGKLI